tara:strand:+ start:24069 stop:24998 length:930 start_codon:yes stop_codon:yes gene_type:complete
MTKVLITGGSGFVGKALLDHPYFSNATVVGRSNINQNKNFIYCALDKNFDLTDELSKVDVVIHLAARAHLMKDDAKDPLFEYRKINTDATIKLVKQAINCGVKRFIYISSIKVLGEETSENKAYKEHDAKIPKDFYGISKAEAENSIIDLTRNCKMDYVIIRPPLIYGNGVKGNFQRLINLTSTPIPLPLGSINNKRSYVSVENLVDLIFVCSEHPNAVNQIFHVSDDADISTTELLNILIKAGGYKARLFNFNATLLKILFYLIGMKKVYQRLFSSLQVDITHAKTTLEWQPKYKIDEFFARNLSSND